MVYGTAWFEPCRNSHLGRRDDWYEYNGTTEILFRGGALGLWAQGEDEREAAKPWWIVRY